MKNGEFRIRSLTSSIQCIRKIIIIIYGCCESKYFRFSGLNEIPFRSNIADLIVEKRCLTFIASFIIKSLNAFATILIQYFFQNEVIYKNQNDRVNS